MMERFDILSIILSLIGLLALYWAMFGQWKFNRIQRETGQDKEEKMEDKK